MRIAIIPARGGSKRIPGKNIREFLGTPVIGRVIKTLKESQLFDRIIVSTDDKDVSQISLDYGAEVPFIRPATLSDDFTGTAEVVIHAIKTLNLREDRYTQICCVYPTSVLLKFEDIFESLKLLNQSEWLFVFAATKPNSSPFRSFVKDESGGLEMLFPKYWQTRSQDLRECYVDAGLLYWGTVQGWLGNQPIFGPSSTFIEIPQSRVVDINTESDWLQAELIYRLLEAETVSKAKE